MPKEPITEKPLPKQHGRHKSTGTINALVETRRQASDQYMRAQRAEKAYRARKNATIARNTLTETREHFKEGCKHFGLAFRGLVAVVRAVPYLAGEKRDIWRRKVEGRKRKRAESQRKKLEEKLAREYPDGDEGGDVAEGSGKSESEKDGSLGKGGKK
ncbi:hypothetical protein HD806DRAFT_469406 [Xylariaceae sp. AK1471]|nr:hypothetical protein HD806DRAFT_469406 [Xylariaceae sp. AK1471]